ncbi:tetratricopeptide repeat protein 34 [Pezoporus wallicus]|uniref:tetratricopeptide repeat protein 34 n=1 Tax=Pezoporus wallicus TaxID=35540 RepID=UPI002550109F|nr:tetratricopeptide repeat protein 34 [Pezoporus wallicus]XP_061306395.1 tetratricopeptide repeat protein 34 [Pezoporus flaviventris]
MSAQELAALLCKEGDHHLAQQELPIATAFYMAAFSCSAPTAVQKVNSLDKGLWEKVIATLEMWCQGKNQIPKIQSKNLAIVSLSVGIAAIFLSTLSPNNVVSSVYKLQTLLRQGCSEEVVSKCNTLLEAHPKYSMELLLLRALARVLSGTQVSKGIVDYIQAFAMHRVEAVAYVCTRQRDHLPQVIQAFSNYLLTYQEESPGSSSLDQWLGNCYDFLAALAPDDIWVCGVQAAYLLKKSKFEECVAVCSKALKGFSSDNNLRDEKALGLLLERAAAYFFLGGRVQEMVQDLAEAFAAAPAQAMKRFEELFSPHDTEKIEKQARTVLEVKFAAYREAVRTRTELRGNHGTELLPAVIQTVQFLLQISPGSKRELSVRLADCHLLHGHIGTARDICDHLLAAEQKTYYNTLLALRGFCSLHTQDHQQALQDFQRVIEHDSPHPNSCIKALCGRGLTRISGGSNYLTALDYITACQLKLEETIFTIKSYVPWNQRGLLLKVLQEEGQKMLQMKRDAPGVYQLASLLVELDISDEASRILCADALYQMGRAEEAHKLLLVALSRNPQRSPILARLALLQLKKGFMYDGNQLLKKVIRIGDTSCLLPIMDIFKDEDRKLMQTHCHFRALTILKNKQEDADLKEAIAYLSFAIIASGGYAEDCLLIRARCYGHLGQKKTAIFDFNAILKEDPRNVQALSGRGFIYLALKQQKEAVQDLISALKVEAGAVIPAILALKHEAQGLITQWLLQHGRAALIELAAAKDLSKEETLRDLLMLAKALIKIDRDAPYHIFYTDVLIANGRYEEALKHLQEAFGCSLADDFASARLAVLQLKRRNVTAAAHSLSVLAKRDERELEFLLNFIDAKRRQHLAQVAAQQGNALIKEHSYEKALGYYSLAALASKGSPRYLRQRAACLMHLKRYDRALQDLEKVIQQHGRSSLQTRAEDHCSKGHLLLSVAEEGAAVKQYIEALKLDESVALCSIMNGPGSEMLTKAFLKVAQYHFEMQHYEEAWEITAYGLKIDKNAELKKLKTRLKREASSCSIH